MRNCFDRSELICRVKWNNTLPDLPFDPKFITYPFETNRFIKYKQTSLEQTFKHDLVTEHDLGVTIDLINPETYAIPLNQSLQLHHEDERLLEEENALGSGAMSINEKRSKQHNKVVPWLKKTEYISTEFNRYGASSEKSETKVGYNVKKKFKEDVLYLDRDSQIAQINKTFEEAKKPITQYHHPKKDVVPVAIYPVFPDFENWRFPFAQVTFDAEPVASGSAETSDVMSEAMIRGMMDERGEQFVAYFLPSSETLEKRKRDTDSGQDFEADDEYEYKMAREYNWTVKNKNHRGYEENYFFVLRDDCVYYNELETRVRLSKRRAKVGPTNNSKLIVRHRTLNDQELKTQDIRQSQLMPVPQEEEVRKTICCWVGSLTHRVFSFVRKWTVIGETAKKRLADRRKTSLRKKRAAMKTKRRSDQPRNKRKYRLRSRQARRAATRRRRLALVPRVTATVTRTRRRRSVRRRTKPKSSVLTTVIRDDFDRHLLKHLFTYEAYAIDFICSPYFTIDEFDYALIVH